jgi:hypothetical protein
MTDKYILEITAQTSELESMEWASMLCRAFTRWCDRNSITCNSVSTEDERWSGMARYIPIILEGDASQLVGESGLHRRRARSIFHNEDTIVESVVDVQCYQANESNDVELTFEYIGARPGGGGGSPAFVKAISSIGVLRSPVYRNESREKVEADLGLILRSRPAAPVISTTRSWCLGSTFYGLCAPNGYTDNRQDWVDFMEGDRLWH